MWLTRRSRTAAWCTQCCWKVRWRSQDLKLNFYADDASELYDLAEDPGEIVNRYDDPACRNRPQELLEEIARFLIRHPRVPDRGRNEFFGYPPNRIPVNDERDAGVQEVLVSRLRRPRIGSTRTPR